VVEGGLAHMARTRENNCADEAEHGVTSHGGGRDSVSRIFRGAVDDVLTKTWTIICNIRTMR
jgi:hypothetical protein